VTDSELNSLATRYAQAWCSQDPKRVAAFFAEKGSLCVNDGAPAMGRAAIAEVARGFMEAFPDMVVTFDQLESRGERIVFHWTLTGTNTGPGGTGKRVRLSGFESWLIGHQGVIVESLGHFDGSEYERQLQHGCNRPGP
jgi:uncharacterized protein (TIGR02246 family)